MSDTWDEQPKQFADFWWPHRYSQSDQVCAVSRIYGEESYVFATTPLGVVRIRDEDIDALAERLVQTALSLRSMKIQ